MLIQRRRRGGPATVGMETLEARCLLAAAVPSAYEQYMVELLNRARANPTAEASRNGIALNEGLAAGTISTAAKQPVAINAYITDAARGHSQWMINVDLFQHEGSGGSDPGDRMAAAGYVFTGSWSWGENLAWSGLASPGVATTASLHESLFVDEGIAGRGHRINMMAPDFREIGVGIVTGNYRGYNAVMATQDFAYSGSGRFLTGVAYSDSVDDDNFYTPGEGLAGVTIQATRVSDGAVFSTTTWASGGYSLLLSAGTYNVRGSGGALAAAINYNGVVIGTQNVKRDFVPAAFGDDDVKVAVFRDGQWGFDRNGNRQWDAADVAFTYGMAGDAPAPGDWSGDGKDKAGISRNGWWALDLNGSRAWEHTDAWFSFGTAGDQAVTGDWNGDGRDEVGVFRSGWWYLDYNGSRAWNTGDAAWLFGGATSKPVAGDWNGDGRDDIGVFDKGIWYLDANGNGRWDGTGGGDAMFGFGQTGHRPIVGDWNGDGRDDAGVVSFGLWYRDMDGSRSWDSSRDLSFFFGLATDTPVTGRWG